MLEEVVFSDRRFHFSLWNICDFDSERCCNAKATLYESDIFKNNSKNITIIPLIY